MDERRREPLAEGAAMVEKQALKSRCKSAPGPASLLALVLLVAACQSPNRGSWAGTFDGSVAGTVEFRINARGTRLTGELSGETQDRQPFAAEMEGRLSGDRFYAKFAGKSRAGMLPVAFEGLMEGELKAGHGEGEWSCELRFNQRRLKGHWRVEQVSTD